MEVSLPNSSYGELQRILDELPIIRGEAPSIVFITGASGIGKSHLVDSMEEVFSHERLQYIRFDRIGVPSEDEMTRLYGSGTEWQRASTIEWVRRFVEEYANKSLIVFEGQYNLDFAREACNIFNIDNFRFVVLTVSDAVMAQRLTEFRKQPELVNDDMRNWSRFLREQGESQNALIIDTSEGTTSQAIDSILGEALKLVRNVVSSGSIGLATRKRFC